MAKMPEIQNTVLNEFPKKFEDFFNDNFGFRMVLTRWNSILRIKYFNFSPVSWVVIGKEGWLYLNDGDSMKDHRGLLSYTNEELSSIKRTLENQRDWLSQMGIPYLIVIVPNKETVYPEFLPDTINRVTDQTRLDQLVQYLGSHSNLNILDLRDALQKAKSTYPVYYRTDSHWNDYGAFIGYYETLKKLKDYFPWVTTVSISDFKIISRTCCGRELSEPVRTGGIYNDEALILLPRANANSDKKQIVKAVIFADSFYYNMEPYFKTSIREITPNGIRDFDYNVINNVKPDVVIYELIERRVYSDLLKSSD
jgi:hypothetical protein